MITAEEARKHLPRTVKDKVEDLSTKIEELSKQNIRSLRTGYDWNCDQDLWIQGGYSKTLEWLEAKSILEDLGYTVSFYYRETQFVDMYTLIEW